MQLHYELSIALKSLVSRTTMAALAAEHALIPAAAGLYITDGN